MNLRFDKVIRVVALGMRRVYSLVLADEGLYLIQTGHVGALRHYRLDAESHQIVPDNPTDRGVQGLRDHESRIDTVSLGKLAQIKDNYFVRLEAIEDIELKTGKPVPEVWIGVTGSEHHLYFPFASWEEVQTLQRALNKWLIK